MKQGNIYRYRSIERLLNDSELSNHYFYLSPANEENDINEGRPIFYLKGDKLFWKGVFRFYYLLIYRHYFNGTEPLDYISNDTKFVNDKVINLFIAEVLSGNKVYFYQMNYIFTTIDSICSKYILAAILKHRVKKDNICLNDFISLFNQIKNLDVYENFLYSHFDAEAQRHLFKSHNDKGFDLFLKYFGDVNFYNIVKSHGTMPHNTYLKFMNLHQQFIHKLTGLVLPKMYIVSFSDRYDNDEMWANYAGKYNGACLEFYTFDKMRTLYNWRNYKTFYLNKHSVKYLYKVRYTSKIPKYNLFKYFNLDNGVSLNPYLNHTSNNLLGFIFKEIFNTHELSRYFMQLHGINYYNARRLYMCTNAVSFKNKDWRNENEYRLIYFNNAYHNYNKNPKQYYDFYMLKSLTLGSKVNLKDENKVIHILDSKCKRCNRRNFPIYKITRKRSGKLGRNLFWLVNPSYNYLKLI